jgi:hypothetical protein
MRQIFTSFCLFVCAVATIGAQRVAILRDVRQIQVLPTVVSKAEKVKEDFAPNLVQDSLRNALHDSNFELSDDAPVRARAETSCSEALTRVR